MKKLYLFTCLLVYLFNVNAQECGFETPENYQTFDEFNQQRVSATAESYCINVCFRIVRDNDGTNAAVSPTIIPQALTQLNNAFNPHGIFFNQVGTYDYVNSTSYNNYTSAGPALIPNCLNIFFIKDFSTLGSSVSGVGSFGTNRSVIKGSMALSNNNIAHEVGHNLNLLHTFQCTSIPVQSCTENPLDSSQCEIKGDKVCDTPADYNPFVYNSSNPPPYPISNYNPKKNNIMSYWLTKTEFTTKQGERMKNAILGATQLQSIRSFECAKIVGRSRLCRPSQGSYSVSGAFGTPTYSWSASGGIQINGSTTSPTVNVSKISNTTGVLSVTLNGATTKTKNIRTRCSFWGFRIAGVYDWISKDYGNMGLVIPIDPIDEDDPIVTYNWEIMENPDATTTNNEGTKPYFIGANSNETNKFTSSTNQAVVNWGSSSNSYLITCNGISASGEEFLINENYVEVGDPKNNPCFKDAVQSAIAPNPVKGGQVNVVVIKPEHTSPCNYKNLEEPQFFNSKLDRVNNSITIFDMNGTEIYSNVFETNEFTIDGLNLISGNNYVVNLYTNEGGFRQQVIIAE